MNCMSSKIRVRGCIALLVFCGVLEAQNARPLEYALILSDPPIARHLSSRRGLVAQSARDEESRLRVAQQRVIDQLAQKKIEITGSSRMLVNAVFVRATEARVPELRSISGVTRVEYLPPVHRKLDRALPLVNASAAWRALGGDQNAGKGVKIGILDTGIDQNHPAFQDSSLSVPSGFPKGDKNYTSQKVIVARSYVAMLPFKDVLAADSRPDDVTPRDRSGHGTAIAMIAAGERVTAPPGPISGIAPKAFLGSYKIFGSPGVNDTTRTPVIIQALEDAISDGMDIVALPVGDPAVYGPLQTDASCAGSPPGFNIPSTACDVRAQAVESAVHLGLTVVVPAGNDGDSGLNYPALSSIDTPGTAPSAITVGASTNSHIFYAGVIIPGKDAPTRLIHALFGDGQKLSTELTAPLRDVSQLQNDGRACAALPPKSLSGAIALVQRGDCAFSIKALNAANAGALAMIIVQSTGNELPFPPTGVAFAGIPVVMAGNSDGAVLQSVARTNPSQQVTLSPTFYGVDSTPDVVATFSSRGPVIFTGAIKPDLVAPGADLYTAAQSYDPNGDVYDPSGFTAVSGTSFASGLVAGAAALVKQVHPSYTPGQIKSALVNSASGQVTDNGATARITAAGAGKLDAGAAVAAPVTIEPATVSFGVLDRNTTFPVTVPLKLTNTLTNATTTPMRINIEVRPTDQDSLAHVVASQTTLLLAGQTQITVQLQGALSNPGSYEGVLLLHAGSVTLRVPYLYVVGDANPDNVLPLAGSSFDGAVNDQGFFLILKLIDPYGVAVTGEPVQFNVASGDGVITATDPATDVVGIAAGNVNLGSQIGEQIFTADIAGFHVEFDGRARPRPTISAGGVVNAGSHQAGKGLAAGSYVEIYGAGLSETTNIASTHYLPVSLAGVSVSFDAPGISVPGHIYFVTPRQVDVQIPWELQGQTSAQMKVSVGESQSAVYTVALANASPAAFQIPDSANGRLVAAALDTNNHVISTANPARRNQTISLYVNGLGAVNHTPASGDPTPSQQFATTAVTPTVTIGGANARVAFSGLSPSSIGLYQINVTVPSQAPAGLQPVVITIDGIDSQPANLPVQ